MFGVFAPRINRNARLIGEIKAWDKTFSGVPSLANQGIDWINEANGQVVTDASSPLVGKTLPNLNNSGGGATNRMLRGAPTSGTTGGIDTTHTHTILLSSGASSGPGAPCASSTSTVTTSAIDARPAFYTVVWGYVIK